MSHTSDLPSDRLLKLLVEDRKRRGDSAFDAELYALRHLKAIVNRLQLTHPTVKAAMETRARTIEKYVIGSVK